MPLTRSIAVRRAGAAAAIATAVAFAFTAATPRASVPAPIPAADLPLKSADPALYALARQYFPSDDIDPPLKRIFRLTRTQIDESVRTLLPAHYKTSVTTVMARDPLQTNYEYAEVLSVNSANHAPLTKWIGEIADRVRKSPAGVIDCPSGKAGPAADECLDSEARRFALKAFRGDAATVKLDRIATFFRSRVKASGLGNASGDLVEIVLNSPDFLFRKELDTNRRGRVAPPQVLQSLSYMLADRPPEALGLASQSAPLLLQTKADTERTVDGILAGEASRRKLARFFEAWLEIRDPAEYTISTMLFPDFKPELAKAMVADTRRFLEATLKSETPTLKNVTQSNEAFISKPLEGIYGVKAPDAAGTKRVALDPAQRLGVFSQPSVIASHSGPDGTRPIKRGVFWVRKVMCMEMEPPPKDLHAELYDLQGATERQKIEASTQGNACIGCHKVINPFGFFLESYDTLGRFRTTENGHAIDASITVDFLDEGKVSAPNAVEALKTFTNSAMFKQCFVRQLFRYYMGRTEEPSDDPLLRRMFVEFALDDRQDIMKAVRTLALSDRVTKRQ